VKLWFLQGFLLFARYGTRFEVGCRPCVRSRISARLVANLLFGWWCFPWGIGTPFVVLQNLAAFATPGEGALNELLTLAGVPERMSK
jgi:hypothetical protein